MNEIKEVIMICNALKKCITSDQMIIPNKDSDCKDIVKTMEIAIEVLEKQIPKKILKEWDSTVGENTYYRFHCPNCENQIMNPNANYKYCPGCGQKLDWSVEDGK